MLKELKARARRERSPSPEARTIEIETKQGHAYSIQERLAAPQKECVERAEPDAVAPMRCVVRLLAP